MIWILNGIKRTNPRRIFKVEKNKEKTYSKINQTNQHSLPEMLSLVTVLAEVQHARYRARLIKKPPVGEVTPKSSERKLGSE
jgi:hypothetical protein